MLTRHFVVVPLARAHPKEMRNSSFNPIDPHDRVQSARDQHRDVQVAVQSAIVQAGLFKGASSKVASLADLQAEMSLNLMIEGGEQYL